MKIDLSEIEIKKLGEFLSCQSIEDTETILDKYNLAIDSKVIERILYKVFKATTEVKSNED